MEEMIDFNYWRQKRKLKYLQPIF